MRSLDISPRHHLVESHPDSPRPLQGGGHTFALSLLSAILFLVFSIPLHGQGTEDREGLLDKGDFHGLVVDAGSEAPLEGVEVWVPDLELAYLTREDGSFRIPDVTEGTYRVELRRLGYTDLFVTLEIDDPFQAVEFGMEPNPVVLEGLEVVVDRFDRRRRAVPYPTRVLKEADLRASPARDAAELIFNRLASRAVTCPPRAPVRWCVWVRGQTIMPSVYIDESPAWGGVEQLAMYLPHELYMVEVFQGGRHIRAYTHHFMERAAEQRLMPMMIR